MTPIRFEHIADTETVIIRAGATHAWERLVLTAVALGSTADAYRSADHEEHAAASWTLVTDGSVATTADPAAHYRERGHPPEQAALLGERIVRTLRGSRWGVPEPERAHPIGFVSAQGVPAAEVPTLVTLAALTPEAAARLEGEVHAEELPLVCLVRPIAEPGAPAAAPQRWAGLLASRLDHPRFLELEIRQLLLEIAGALIDQRADFVDWIPRERHPGVRVCEPRDYPGLPLVGVPFTVQSAAAARAFETDEMFARALTLSARAWTALQFAHARAPGPAH